MQKKQWMDPEIQEIEIVQTGSGGGTSTDHTGFSSPTS